MDIKLLLRPLVMRQHQFSVLFLVIIIDRCLHLQSVPAQSQFLTDGFLSLLLRSSLRQKLSLTIRKPSDGLGSTAGKTPASSHWKKLNICRP